MKYCLFPPRDFKVQEMGAYETWWIFLRLWFLAVGGLLNSGIGNKNSQQPHFHMVSYWTSLINSCFVSYKIQPNLLYFVFQSFDFEYTWWSLYQKLGCTRLPTASDKVYQLLAHGRWFSPDTPASSITRTGRHDIAEILLKVASNTKSQSINQKLVVRTKFNIYIFSTISRCFDTDIVY